MDVIPVRRVHDRLQYTVQHSRDLDVNHRRHRKLPCLLYLAEPDQSTSLLCVHMSLEFRRPVGRTDLLLRKNHHETQEEITSITRIRHLRCAWCHNKSRRRGQQRTNKRHQDNDHHFYDVRDDDTLREFRIRNSFVRRQRVHGQRYILLRVCFSVFHELLAGSVHLRILQQRSETAHSTSFISEEISSSCSLHPHDHGQLNQL